MKKWLNMIGVAAIGTLLLTACGQANSPEEEPAGDEGGEAAPSEEVAEVTIGATQIVEHPSLDAAYEGFKAALADNGFVEGENVTYNFQSAQGDQNNIAPIANNFVADNVDLIFTNSTPSTLGVLNATKEIPIVFASVSNPVDAGIVEALDKPGENITGVIDLHPDFTTKTLEFIEEHFDGARIGYIYNSGEQNSVSQLEAIKEAMEGKNLSLVERTVATPADVQQAADSLIGNIDVLLMTTDNTVVQGVSYLVDTANEYDIPLIVGDPDSLEAGGFATYGIDFYSHGYLAGEMAVQILKGEKAPSEMNIKLPPKLTLIINKTAAEAQGVEWNAAWDTEAEIIE